MAQAQTRSAIKEKNDAYYSCMAEMQRVEHMKKPWTVRYVNSNNEEEIWHIVAETKRDSGLVSKKRKQVRQRLRWDDRGFSCQTCADNGQEGMLYWGPDGSLIFSCPSHGLEVVEECRGFAEEVRQFGLKSHTHMHLRLLTRDILNSEHQKTGIGPNGEEYQHFTPQSEQFHEKLDKRGQTLDTALRNLFPMVHAFIEKLIGLVPGIRSVQTLRQRVATIEKCLGETAYGLKTYGHAVKWVAHMLALLDLYGLPLLHRAKGGRSELVESQDADAQ